MHIKKKPIRDLKMGGGIGEEAVNGGAVLGGRLYKLNYTRCLCFGSGETYLV